MVPCSDCLPKLLVVYWLSFLADVIEVNRGDGIADFFCEDRRIPCVSEGDRGCDLNEDLLSGGQGQEIQLNSSRDGEEHSYAVSAVESREHGCQEYYEDSPTNQLSFSDITLCDDNVSYHLSGCSSPVSTSAIGCQLIDEPSTTDIVSLGGSDFPCDVGSLVRESMLVLENIDNVDDNISVVESMPLGYYDEEVISADSQEWQRNSCASTATLQEHESEMSQNPFSSCRNYEIVNEAESIDVNNNEPPADRSDSQPKVMELTKKMAKPRRVQRKFLRNENGKVRLSIVTSRRNVSQKSLALRHTTTQQGEHRDEKNMTGEGTTSPNLFQALHSYLNSSSSQKSFEEEVFFIKDTVPNSAVVNNGWKTVLEQAKLRQKKK